MNLLRDRPNSAMHLRTVPLSLDQCAALGNAIATDADVKDVALVDCVFKEGGLRAILGGLQKSTSITALSFDDCFLGNQGARALAEAIKYHGSLKRVLLNNANIEEDGAACLLDAVQYNYRLGCFYMSIGYRECPFFEQSFDAAMLRNRWRRPKIEMETTQWMLVNRKLRLTCNDVERLVCAFIATHFP